MRAPVRALIAGSLAAGLAGGLPVTGVSAAPGAPTPGLIATRVGGPGGGPALSVSQGPTRVSPGPGDSVYVADTTATVRQFSRAAGMEKVIAGVAAFGFSGDGGLAAAAGLKMGNGSYLGSAAPDRNGNLIIADSSNDRLRAVAARNGTFYGLHMLRGHIYTIVGNGTAGFSGDGGPARDAEFHWAGKIAIDPAGNIVFPDTGNNRVRVAAEQTGTFYGKHMTAGDIYTVAGSDPGGPLGNGGPATKAELNFPGAVAIDHAGNLVIADTFDNRVRVVAAKTGLFYGKHMTAGDIYLIAGNGKNAYSGDGGPASAASLIAPIAVAVDKAGNVAITGRPDSRLRMVAVRSGRFFGKRMVRGHIYRVAGTSRHGYFGNGGPAAKAGLNQPEDVAADATGNLLIADTGNNRVRVLAVKNGTFYGVAMKAAHLYTIAGNGKRTGSGDGHSSLLAQLARPQGTAVSGNGGIVIAETGGNRVRLAAAASGTLYGRKMTAGRIYTIAGDGKHGFGGDGGLATSATLQSPEGVALDHSGNLVIADTNNFRVRVVAAKTGTFYGRKMTAGRIYTIAGDGSGNYTGNGGPATSAGLTFPFGVAVDAAGNVLVTQEDHAAVRVIAATSGTFYGQAMTATHIYAVAGDGNDGYAGDGGPATAAELSAPIAVVADPAGNVVISDSENNRVRVVAESAGTFYGRAMMAGDIYTIAGNGGRGYSGDGGPAATAEIFEPWGLAFDRAGNLLLSDSGNERVQMIAAATGSSYGAPRTAGDIYTIAGNGQRGFSGDGGAATSASMEPLGLAAGPGGEVVINDGFSNRIRVVSE
jgi:NHL repeat-containing protein